MNCPCAVGGVKLTAANSTSKSTQCVLAVTLHPGRGARHGFLWKTGGFSMENRWFLGRNRGLWYCVQCSSVFLIAKRLALQWDMLSRQVETSYSPSSGLYPFVLSSWQKTLSEPPGSGKSNPSW
jgi:hypothetical protein